MERSEVEALKNEIRRIARESYYKVIKEAEEKAKTIIDNAVKKAEEIRVNMRNKAVKEAREEANQKIMALKMKYRSELIRLKQRLVEEVFSQAMNKVMDFIKSNRGEYKKIMRKLLLEALREVGEYREYVIYVRAGDEEVVEEIVDDLKRNYPDTVFKVSRSPVEFIGGLIVYAPSARIFYNNTFDARLNYVREHMVQEIYSLLFKECGVK